jgi:hypothetical protein
MCEEITSYHEFLGLESNKHLLRNLNPTSFYDHTQAWTARRRVSDKLDVKDLRG